jgi:hypothetical protein
MEAPMASSSHEADVLEAVVVGIPRLAHAITAMSTTHTTAGSQELGVLQVVVAGIPRMAQVSAAMSREHRARALDAGEHNYVQTFQDIDYSEAAAKSGLQRSSGSYAWDEGFKTRNG